MNYTTPDIKQQYSDKTEIPYFSPLLMITFSFIISVSMLWPNSMNQFYAMIVQPFSLYLLFSLSCFAYILMMFIEVVTLALDKKYKWEDDFLKRLTFQLVYGGLAAVVLLVPIYCIYLYILEIDLGRYLHLDYILFVVIMLNMMYGFYYYVELVHLGIKTLKEGKPDNQNRNYFTVPEGIGRIEIALTEIAYFYRDDRDVYLKSFDGKKYPLWESLDEIQKELDNRQFFRLNRKHIVNRNAILNATKNIRKGMDVHIIQVSTNANSTVNELKILDLSREKAPEFKSWLKKDNLTSKDSPNTTVY